MTWNVEWEDDAACHENDPDAMFVLGAAQQQAKTVCFRCKVRTECLAYALDGEVRFGVWGGMTERERRRLLLINPDVKSWREVFETAMSQATSATPPLSAN